MFSRGGKAGAVQGCDRCRSSGKVLETRQLGPGIVQQMTMKCPCCNGEGIYILVLFKLIIKQIR